MGAAAWTQSWRVVRRGHFRITAWIVVALAVLTLFAVSAADAGGGVGVLAAVLLGGSVAFLLAQYVDGDLPGAVLGGVAAAVGLAALGAAGEQIREWPSVLAALGLVAGALFLGAVTNGMMLGHWYLNQPGLKPWALGRLTTLATVGVLTSAILGLSAAPLLIDASTEGAVLGLPGFGDNFGPAFYVIWLVLLAFTGSVVWAARRCVKIRSIQSATGLYYVALLTAGVSEFLIRYLMVNAT
jgi:hypothetical protein